MGVKRRRRAPAKAGEHRLRLLSYNMQVGLHTRHYGDYVTRAWGHVLPSPGMRHRLDATVNLVAPYDFVAVQEADAGSLRTLGRNQLEYLAGEAGFEHYGMTVTRNLRPLARHCLGFLSRYRPQRIEECHLPSRVPGRRGLIVTLGPDAGGLVILITHLSLGASSRRLQLNYLCERIPVGQPVVMLGDLNCEPDALLGHAVLRDSGMRLAEVVPATFPSWNPQRRIDHVLVSPEVHIHRLEALGRALSDHLPLAVDVGFRSARAR